MTTKLSLLLLLTVTLAVGAGCVPDAPITEPTPVEATLTALGPIPSETVGPPASAPAELALTEATGAADVVPASPTPAHDLPADMLAGPQVAQARADLAARLGVGPEDIVVVSVRPVTWPDASLGCVRYATSEDQRTVAGWAIRLGYNGQVFDYRGGDTGGPAACDDLIRKLKQTPDLGSLPLTPQPPP